MGNIKKQLKTVRGKLFLTLCIVVISIILFLILVNNLVLEKYYQYSKSNTLKSVYNTINSYYNGEIKIDNLEDKLNQVSASNNFDIIIKDQNDVDVYLSNKDFLSNIRKIIDFWGINQRREYQIIEESDKLELTNNEFLRLGIRIYSGVENVRYVTENYTVKVNLLNEKKTESRRKKIDELLLTYIKLLNSNDYELTNLVTNFYMDFINIKPFNIGNEVVGLMLIYLLLLKEQFKMFHYVSFFELIYENYDEFKSLVNKANFNYEDGYSQTAPLNNFIIDILIDGYNKVDKLASDTKFDGNIMKTYNIENTIMKLGEVFTKEDVRAKHPYVSLSTIDRTLKRMREENKIRPLGVGRSASWVRISNYERFDAGNSRQMSLYDIIMNNQEEDEKAEK